MRKTQKFKNNLLGIFLETKSLIRDLVSKKTWVVFKYSVKHPRKFWNALSANTKKWTYRGLVAFLIVAIGVPMTFWLTSKKTEAAWWNDSWMYRKSIAVTNSSGGTLTDFQVKVLSNVDLSADITAGKIQSDLDDLRFTDINGKLLPYWIEDSTAASVDVWAKLPNIPTTGATVYMYYGNFSASAYSDGNRTFEFFDDFSVDLSKWTNPSGCAATISSGTISIPSSATCDIGPVYANGLNLSDTTGYIFETRGKFSSGGSNRLQIYQKRRNANSYVARFWTSGTNTTWYQEYNGSWVGDTNVGANNMSADTWYDLKVKVNGSNNTFYVNGNSIGSATSTASLTPFTDFTIGLGEYQTAVQYDNVRIRKYASTDSSAGSLGSEEKSTGPVGYWKFDEGSGNSAQDGTSNNLDGTISGAVWKPESECVSGKCLWFDGEDDYVSIADDNKLDLTDYYTLQAWVKPPKTQTDCASTYRGVLTKGGLWDTAAAYQMYYYCGASPGSYASFLRYGTGTYDHYSFSATTAENDWQLVTIVKDGSTSYTYINGVQKSSTESSSDTQTNGRAIYIGGTATNGDRYFTGFIDEVKIYNYARSAAQVKMDYNVGSAGSPEGGEMTRGGKSQKWMTDGLVGYWKMDEASWNGTSGEVIDASGNGKNGTAGGGATTASGKFGNSGSFDGTDDYASISSSYNLGGVDKNTTAMWFYPTNNADTLQVLFTSRPSGGGANGVQVDWDSGGNINCYIGTGSWGNASYATSNVTTSQWHHLACVYDGTNIKMYVDGTLKNSASKIGNITSGSYSAYFGNYDGSFSTYSFYGKIDELRNYNRALSPQEISDLYNWAPGPIGYWKMDEKSGTYAEDSSGNSHRGTLSNSSAWVPGKVGGGVNFAGSNYIEVPDSDDWYFGSSDFTVGFWVNPNSFAYYKGLVYQGETGANQSINDIEVYNDGRVRWLIRNASGTLLDILSTPSLTVGQWKYVTAVRSGSNFKIYFDGVEVGSGSSATALENFAYSLFIGSRENYQSNRFDGKIDDVKIYRYARTPDQIKEDMLGRDGGGVSAKSAVGYWKFDEGNQSTANDSSGNNNNGTITGATWNNDGKFGKALNFTENSVAVADSTSLRMGTNDFSISMWVKPTTGGDAEYFMASKTGSGSYRFSIYPTASTRRIYAYLSDGTNSFSQSIGGTAIPFDSWSYITVIFNRSIGKVQAYLNGVYDGQGDISSVTGVVNPTGSLYLGYYNGSSYEYRGLMDEVKIYNYALTPDEIKKDMAQGQAMTFGSTGTDSSGNPDNSASREYCVPGNTTDTCNPPIAEWKLDEKTGTTANDTSTNGRTATFAGSPSWTQGKFGSAVSLNGSSDYLSLTRFTYGSTGLTLSAWIKTTSTDATKTYSGNAAQNVVGDTTNGVGLGFGITGGKIQFCDYTGVWECVTGLTDANDGQWHNIAVTYATNNAVILYLDGKVDNTGTITYGSEGIDVIGRGYSADYFTGQIDNVKVFNYARTPAQIAWDYNRGGPVGWWRMDEGEGTTAYDYSGNGNSGTLTSMDPPNDWVDGRLNKALDFDGSNDYVDMGTDDSLKVSGDVTISAWIYSPLTSDGYIVGKGTGNDYAQMWYLRANATDTVEFIVGNSAGNGYGIDLTTTETISANTWTHLLVNISGTTANIYINGRFSKSGTVSSRQINDGNLYVGKRIDSFAPFNGKIDDVRIYNYALTAQQIKDVYNGGVVNFK